MRYVAAYLLASLGGQENPQVGDLQKILGSVGIDCDDERAKSIIDSLSGKNLDEVVAKGKEKLASVPSGGGGAVAAAVAPAASGEAEAEKKEEKKEESEEEDEDMGFGLFD